MAAIDQALVSILLNGLTPTGTTSAPGTAIGTPVGTSTMKIRLNSTLSTASAAGTDIGTQTSGYTAGGWTLSTSSTVSSAGSAVGVPGSTQSFVSSGSPTAVVVVRPDRLRGAAGVLGAVQRPARQRRLREHVPGRRRQRRSRRYPDLPDVEAAAMSLPAPARQIEALFTLPAAVTKNTYTTEAAFSGVARHEPRVQAPGRLLRQRQPQPGRAVRCTCSAGGPSPPPRRPPSRSTSASTRPPALRRTRSASCPPPRPWLPSRPGGPSRRGTRARRSSPAR